MGSDPAITLARWFSGKTQHLPVKSRSALQLKWAIKSGELTTPDDLSLWMEAMLRDGFGYHDALYLSLAHESRSEIELRALNDLCLAYCEDAGRSEELSEHMREFSEILEKDHSIRLAAHTAFPVAVGHTAAYCGLPLDMTSRFYLGSLSMRIVHTAALLMEFPETDSRSVKHKVLALCDPLSKAALNPARGKSFAEMFEMLSSMGVESRQLA